MTNTVDEIIPEVVALESAVQATTNGTSGVCASHPTDSAVKFENISDNGSEISDEGYRSLGLIQQNGQQAVVEKRASVHSQLSTEDADYSGE